MIPWKVVSEPRKIHIHYRGERVRAGQSGGVESRQETMAEGSRGRNVAHSSGTQRARGGSWEKGLERERVDKAWQAFQKIPTIS